MKQLFAILAAILAAIGFGFARGISSEKSKQTQRQVDLQARNVDSLKIKEKINEENSNLDRDQLIDKL